MKLFLASSFDKTANVFVKKYLNCLDNKKVLFIENASDPLTCDKWWIRSDRQAFEKIGCEIVDVDLRKVNGEEFEKLLSNVGIVHFCGGTVLYLINLIREKGLKDSLIKYIRDEKVIYTGTSAGSMIPAKDLSLCKYDLEEEEMANKITDFSGLELVNFLILPHCNNADMTEANIKMIKELPSFNTTVLMIYDNQAIVVEDDKFEIVNI